jgi:hypothetical protein
LSVSAEIAGILEAIMVNDGHRVRHIQPTGDTLMQIFKFATAGIFLGLSIATPAAAKTCVLAGGEATMVTLDMAKFMASAALNNSMKDKGLKPQGLAKVTCKDPAPLTYCIAQQKACK